MTLVISETIESVDYCFETFVSLLRLTNLSSFCAVNHPNTLDFPVGFFDDPRALASHSHLR